MATRAVSAASAAALSFDRPEDRARAVEFHNKLVSLVEAHARAAEFVRSRGGGRDKESRGAAEARRRISVAMWNHAGRGLTDRDPPAYLRHVLWRMAPAEIDAYKSFGGVPLPEAVSAHVLISLQCDVRPDDVYDLTIGNRIATRAALEIDESQDATAITAAELGGS